MSGPPSRPRAPALSPGAWILVAVALAFAVVSAIVVATGADDGGTPPGVVEDVPEQVAPGVPRGSRGEPSRKAFDPLAYDPAREKDLERRAAAGFAHPLYVLTQGGAVAGAPRTARWRDEIEKAAAGSGFDPAIVESIIFLESSGRPEVIAGGDPENASGLTQILASTGQGLLAMRVDLAASRKLTRQIERAEARGKTSTADRLRARRRRIDERFDPAKALAGTIRYLDTARRTFGREDLAVVSYHMGIGNLEDAIRDFADDRTTPVADIVEREELSYAKLFFGSSPLRDGDAYRTLAELGDDSITYYWRVLAAREILRLYREDPGRLATLQDLHDNKGSAEEVLHPPAETERFDDPGEIDEALDGGDLLPLPAGGGRDLGFVTDRQMGELAKRLKQKPTLYRALRPEALALLVYLAAGTKAIAPGGNPLRVTSTVRDVKYQGLLVRSNPEATSGYSLHTTGYAFDVLRKYRNKAQADAFQFMLDRLEALNLIAWVREPAAIHITVSRDARSLEGLLKRLPKQPG